MSGNGKLSLDNLVKDMTDIAGLHYIALRNLLLRDAYIRDAYRDELSKLLKEIEHGRGKT